MSKSVTDPTFFDSLTLEAVENGRWRLLQPFRYLTAVRDVPDEHRLIRVPPDFITDLASIPRALRWAVTGVGKSRWAAVVHDYLYQNLYDRKLADRIFREALRARGVNWLKAQAMYLGVRSGGWLYYWRAKQEKTR